MAGRAADWRDLLARWGERVLTTAALSGRLPAAVRAAGRLGASGAGVEAIRATEARLGTALPASYRAFLEVSDGWHLALDLVERLLPVAAIDWMAQRAPEMLAAVGLGQALAGVGDHAADPELVTPAALGACLLVGEGGDGVILLNPAVVDASGEWEAWLFEPELGAARHPTFWDLMVAELEGFGGPEPVAAAMDLSPLLAELEAKMALYRRGGGGAFHRGTLLALEAVAERLAAIQAGVGDVPAELAALAEELEAAWQAGVKGHPVRLTSAVPSLVGQPMIAMAVTDGYRQALGIIRWFLEDPSMR